MKHKKIPSILMALACCFLFGCSLKKQVTLTGRTMGTTYMVKVITGRFQDTRGIQEKIDEKLAAINASMSGYMEESEISRFNRMSRIDEDFRVSRDFFQVLMVGRNLHQMTHGAWDATIAPLVGLWGFGNSTSKHKIPEQQEIDNRLSGVGFDKISLEPGLILKKKHPLTTLDVSSIAKGFGVDKISELIEDEGIENYLVEIGGEVYARGSRIDGKAWKVGISTPDPDLPGNQVYRAVSLENRALATSGDYRNFFVENGKRFSHVIDPRTGYPVDNGVVSASVISDTCTFADGLATALMVMGKKESLVLVSQLENVECFLIVQEKDGSFTDIASPGFFTQK